MSIIDLMIKPLNNRDHSQKSQMDDNSEKAAMVFKKVFLQILVVLVVVEVVV